MGEIMIETSDWLIFALVVGARFLLPLLIPFYPLPAIIACLLLDGVDQTIFQLFTKLPLEGYQSYDKALDIHYLTIAYISTFRNWTNNLAFQVSRFLFFFRLVGVVLFETFHLRAILLIFPNTFEYFFIWYEAMKLWWDPRKLTRGAVLGAAAFIWIVIKLPQEYWLHIAQRDVTDTIKGLLGGGPEDAWLPLIMNHLFVILLVVAVLVALVLAVVRYLRRNMPPADHKLSWRADDNTTVPTDAEFARARDFLYKHIFDRDLLEKIVLVGLIVYIFASILPNTMSNTALLMTYVAGLVTSTTAVSHILARRGTTVASGLTHFLMVFALNMVIVYLVTTLFGRPVDWLNAVVFQLILAVLVTLFDRFQPYHEARFPRGAVTS